jgi:hypothetical protein
MLEQAKLLSMCAIGGIVAGSICAAYSYAGEDFDYKAIANAILFLPAVLFGGKEGLNTSEKPPSSSGSDFDM